MREAHNSFVAKRNLRVSSGANIPFVYKKELGNVLINHSLTYTDNHLDVFDYLKDIRMEKGRQYIIPISYGIDGYEGKPENLINLSTLDKNQVMWLSTVLPKKEYFELLGTASHAIFGALRQQALGNIYWCIKNGIKVYLFEDSILYKELKKKGYVLFTIENDLTQNSLSSCLSEVDAKTNYDIYMGGRKNNTAEYRAFLEKEITEKRLV